MVSPQPTAVPKQPVMSYADRAKKAQNPKATAGPRIAPAASVSSSSAPSISSAPSGTTEGPSTSKATSPTAEETPASSAISVAAASRPHSPPALKDTNGHTMDVGLSQPTLIAPKPAAAPPVNVWNLRKEQMAQRAQQKPSPSPQKSPSDQNPSTPSGSSSRPPVTSEGAPTSIALQNLTDHRISPAGPSATITGRATNSIDGDDAFVVRQRLPPAVDDAESWPEVGKAVASASPGTEGKEKEEGEHERETSQSQGPRRGEKPKWVPIPPEELQAAADAVNPNRGQPPHLRNRAPPYGQRHPGSHAPSGPGSGGPSGSGSAQVSQGQSRTHSASGGRQSVSHSQAQSRTGSVHSSPHQALPRRRLPEEGAAPPPGAGPAHPTRSMRSSRSGSPQIVQPYGPAAEFHPHVPRYPPPAPPADSHSPNPEFLNGTYAPPMAPHGPHSHSYSSSRASGSPLQNSYALPPGPYPQAGHMGVPLNPYAIPYGMYPPFAYPYGAPPYMYMSGAPLPPAPAEGAPALPMAARLPAEGADAPRWQGGAGFVLPPPAEYGRAQEAKAIERGRRSRELSFGSIGVLGADKSPSPASRPSAAGAEGEADVSGDGLGLDTSIQPLSATATEQGGSDRAFTTTLVIGVAPGEPTPAHIRSRTQSKGALSERVSSKGTEHTETNLKAEGAADVAAAVVIAGEFDVKVIDLTEPAETKWEFGSTRRVEVEAQAEPIAEVVPSNALGMSPGPAVSTSAQEGPYPLDSAPAQPMTSPSYVSPVTIPPTTIPQLNGAGSPSYTQSALPPASAASSGVGDEWEVKDFGYGFGRAGYAPVQRDDRPPREREYYGRPRRGSYGASFGYERGFERGGYSGRRGRGGYGRGGYHSRNASRGGGYQGNSRQPPPFVVQPPPPDVNGYYAPPPVQYYDPYAYTAYPTIPSPISQQNPPLPMPLSPISFPLDSTRYYLLGQLEYYLSQQNLVTDFFLRQKMDSRGWISIPLIASFNRVRHLTTDLQSVRDVLTLSSLVEVRGDWVRMHQWEQFVLPNAAASTVEGESQEEIQSESVEVSPTTQEGESGHSGEGQAEEEEEEDVVFVLGRDAQGGTWAPDRRLPEGQAA